MVRPLATASTRPSATRCSTSCATRGAACSPRPASPTTASGSATASTPATSARATRSRSGSARATSWPVDRRPRSCERFEAEYRRIYGLTIPDVGVEAVTWRLSAFADGRPGRADRRTVGDGDRRRRTARARCGSAAATDPLDTPVYRRADLGVGQTHRRPGDRRGARDHGGDPSRLDGRGRRRRIADRRVARRSATGSGSDDRERSTRSSWRCCGRA